MFVSYVDKQKYEISICKNPPIEHKIMISIPQNTNSNVSIRRERKEINMPLDHKLNVWNLCSNIKRCDQYNGKN